MAYGSPATEAEIAPYYTHIRGGRAPSPESLEDLTRRYRAIGRSPLSEITRAQAAALSDVTGVPTFVGMKHARPFIADGAAAAQSHGVERLVGLPLAPHFARMSIGAYEHSLREAWPGELVFVRGFHDHPRFVDAVCVLLGEAMAESTPELLVFTAHSLPSRILAEGDPYRDQLFASCHMVAARMRLPRWEFAFQSASHTGEPWLGPDLLDTIERSGARDVLVCPIGFVADHLEILYDLDVEAQEFARGRAIRLRRTASFNARREFIQALAAVTQDALATRSSV
jgi:ferrochelatase